MNPLDWRVAAITGALALAGERNGLSELPCFVAAIQA